MTAFLFYTLGFIAVTACLIAMLLLTQLYRYRRILARTRRLRRRALQQQDEAREMVILHQIRERALFRHAENILAERNLLRAQLVAYSEPPKFGVVRRGTA